MRLPNVDLNLFVVFDAVYEERNLTRAGRVLHITQPAVSNALKRLRQVFNDPLFVRVPHGVSPTPVANNISSMVKEALHLLNNSITKSEEFLPDTADKTFKFSVHDIDEAVLIPKLMEQLHKVAPQVSIECYSIPRRDVEGELAAGSIDFALAVPLFASPQLRSRQIITDRYVCVIRDGHPQVKLNLTLETYLELEHIHVSARRGGIGHVDLALDRLGRRRNIQLRMKNHIAAPQVVAATDLALTIPRSVANLTSLNVLELPFNVETVNQFLYWHKTADRDQANIWMRNLLTGVLA